MIRIELVNLAILTFDSNTDPQELGSLLRRGSFGERRRCVGIVRRKAEKKEEKEPMWDFCLNMAASEEVEYFPSFWILIMSGILRLGDIGASKYYLSAWAIGKVCCPNVGCKSRELFEPNDLDQHYRIIHPKCSFDGKIIEGKNMFLTGVVGWRNAWKSEETVGYED